MAYQDGYVALNSSDQDYTVTFDSAFASAPDVILVQVQNTSGDETKLMITAQVTARSTTGFSFHLSALPNTNNYVASWIATHGDLTFEVLSTQVQRLSRVPVEEVAPKSTELLPFVVLTPIRRTVTRRWEQLVALLWRLVAAPTAPSDAGEVGQMAIDAEHVYLHNGTQWGRLPFQITSDWDASLAPAVVREGTFEIPDETQEVVVTFATPFPAGDPPVPRTLLIINSTDDPVTMVAPAILTAVSLTGFTLLLSAETDSANFTLHYRFEREP